ATAARQARTGHLPGRRRGTGRATRCGRGHRGRDLRGPGRPGWGLRVRDRRGPPRPRRRTGRGRGGRGGGRPGRPAQRTGRFHPVPPTGRGSRPAGRHSRRAPVHWQGGAVSNGHGQHSTDEHGDTTEYAEQRSGYEIHPWKLVRNGLSLEDLAASESLFTLANGHIGLRGSLEEGEPRVVPGTYINGFYEQRPLPHAEVGYGFPESGETAVNVTDGKILRLFVGDSPFDLRYGHTLKHERALDLRSGTLDRYTEWVSPNGTPVKRSEEHASELQSRFDLECSL